MRTYVVTLLLAPASAVALYWVALTVATPNSSSEWLVLLALVPFGAALAWSSLRLRSVGRTVLLGVGMLVSTFFLWWLVLLVALLLAGQACPDDAYECPI